MFEMSPGVALLDITVLMWAVAFIFLWFRHKGPHGQWGEAGYGLLLVFTLSVLLWTTLVAWLMYWWLV